MTNTQKKVEDLPGVEWKEALLVSEGKIALKSFLDKPMLLFIAVWRNPDYE